MKIITTFLAIAEDGKRVVFILTPRYHKQMTDTENAEVARKTASGSLQSYLSAVILLHGRN